MPGKRTNARRLGGSDSSGQAKGAQGWKEINHAAGAEAPTRNEGKASAKTKTARQTSRKAPKRATRRKKPASGAPPARRPTRDTVFIDWVLSWPRHIKQGVMAVILLLFSIILAVGLLIREQAHNPLATLGNAFHALFGLGTPLLIIGLIALAIANLAEAATQTKIIRLGLVVQLAVLGCVLVLESRLLFGGDTGQLIGALLAEPLAGLPALAQQVVVVGTIAVLLLLIFRISWSQMLLALGWLFDRLAALARASFGALAANMSAAQARRAAAQAQAAAADEAEDDDAVLARLRPDDATLPREDEDLASLALLPVPAIAAATTAGRARQPGRSAGASGRARPPANAARRADDDGLDTLPTLEPLPMKAGGTASAAPGRASGPLPAAQVAIHYELPAITLLNGVVEQRQLRQEEMIEALARKVERTLRSFRVEAEVRRSDISVGPTVIRVGIRPLEKVKKDYRGHVLLDDDGQPVMVRTRVSRIMALQNDLALDLEAKSIRMEAPVPGRPYVGVEIPNKQSRLVTLREILASKDYEESRRKSRLTIALGRDVAGRVRIGDLARFPHLLIAGTTGAGKSVCINSIIACLLMQATPDDVRFLMVDPKMVELTGFNGIPHLLSPVVTEVDRVIGTLKRGTIEMERRYRLFSKLGVRNLEAYRKRREQQPELENLPNIVIIIDELADLMMSAPEEVESLICRLAQLARATGIHLVVATQRPSVDVITGLIKANFPTRISFTVSSMMDSRTILDMGGAERLLGKGDMLYLPADAGKPERVQGTFLADDELERIVDHWRQSPQRASAPEQSWEPLNDENAERPLEDDLLPQAEQIVRAAGKATVSLLQRRLGVGYARAGRLIDLLEARGIIGPDTGGGHPRDIIAPAAGGPGANRTGTSATGWQSDTMLPGNLRGTLSPGNSFSQTPPLPPADPHGPAPRQVRPDKRDSGISNARDEEEDVEELDWQ